MTFNAQGSKEIIINVHVWAMKIYVIIVEAFRKKEIQGEILKNIKLMVF